MTWMFPFHFLCEPQWLHDLTLKWALFYAAARTPSTVTSQRRDGCQVLSASEKGTHSSQEGSTLINSPNQNHLAEALPLTPWRLWKPKHSIHSKVQVTIKAFEESLTLKQAVHIVPPGRQWDSKQRLHCLNSVFRDTFSTWKKIITGLNTGNGTFPRGS